jgi:hypothetical protein
VEIEVKPHNLVPDTNCFIDYLSQLQIIAEAGPAQKHYYTLMVPLVGEFAPLWLINSMKMKAELSLCLTEHYAMETYGECFLDLDLGCTPLPLYPRGKLTRYQLHRRLGGPQSRSGRYGEEEILDPTGTRSPAPLPSNL